MQSFLEVFGNPIKADEAPERLRESSHLFAFCAKFVDQVRPAILTTLGLTVLTGCIFSFLTILLGGALCFLPALALGPAHRVLPSVI
jgi:hypothetical protein